MTAKKKQSHNYYECPNTHYMDDVRGVMKTMGENTVELQITMATTQTQMNALGDNISKLAEQLVSSYDRLDKRITTQEQKSQKTTSLLMFLTFMGALLVTELIKNLPNIFPSLFPFIK